MAFWRRVNLEERGVILGSVVLIGYQVRGGRLRRRGELEITECFERGNLAPLWYGAQPAFSSLDDMAKHAIQAIIACVCACWPCSGPEVGGWVERGDGGDGGESITEGNDGQCGGFLLAAG